MAPERIHTAEMKPVEPNSEIAETHKAEPHGEVTATHVSTTAAPATSQTAVMRAVAHQLAMANPEAAPGNVEVALDPEELGRVRMMFVHSDNGLSVVLNIDRPETLDLMRRHIDQLAQEYRSMGFGNTAFEFRQGGTGGDDRATPAPGGMDDAPPADAGEAAPAEGASAPAVTSGVDIRL